VIDGAGEFQMIDTSQALTASARRIANRGEKIGQG